MASVRPTLDVLCRTPAAAAGLDRATLVELLAELNVAQGAITTALLAMPAPAAEPQANGTGPAGVELLTVSEVAKQLRLAKGYVYELVRNGRIGAVRCGRKYVRIHPAAVEQFLVRQSTGLDAALNKIHSGSHDRRRDKAMPQDAGAETNRVGRKIGRASADRLPLGARRRLDPARLSRVAKGVGQTGATEKTSEEE